MITRRRMIRGSWYAISVRPALSAGLWRWQINRMHDLFQRGEAIGSGMINSDGIVRGQCRWPVKVGALATELVSAVADVIHEVARERRSVR